MTSPTHRLGRLAIIASALTLTALFGTAGVAAAATISSRPITAASQPMRTMSECSPACCDNPLCCDPLCCDGMPSMSGTAGITALQRLASSSAMHSESCACCGNSHRATTPPTATMPHNDSAACRHVSHNAA